MVTVEELDADDVDFVKALVTRHHDYTDSELAKGILADWDDSVGRFRKVMPLDYRRVLEAMRSAEAEGLSEEATLQKVMGTTNG
jgi:glutamate synthase (NADPH/NADH) large chain